MPIFIATVPATLEVAGPAAAASKTILAIRGATGQRIKLLAASITGALSSGAALNQIAEICHWDGTAGGTPNATAAIVTPRNADTAAWTPGASGLHYSAEPTVLTVIDHMPFHPSGFTRFDIPDGREYMALDADGFAIRVRNPTNGTQATFMWASMTVDL